MIDDKSLRAALLAGNILTMVKDEDRAIVFTALGDVIGRLIAQKPGGMTDEFLDDFMNTLQRQIVMGMQHAVELGEV